MLKSIVYTGVILFCINYCYSQSGTTSPYSFYGIGTQNFKGTIENQSMGGMSVYTDSIHFNLKNPASYVNKNIEAFPYEGDSRPVKFAIAATHKSLQLKGNTSIQKSNSSSFDYIALSVPIGKFGFGFGLLPFTSVGYKIADIDANNNLVNRYQGNGGVNRVFTGFGYKISHKISVGVDVNFNFGSINNSAIAFAYTPTGVLTEYQTRENSKQDINGLSLNFGLTYKTMLSKNLELSTAVTYAPKASLTSNNQRSYSSILYNAISEAEIVRNTVEIDLVNTIDINGNLINLEKTDLVIPSKLSFGFGLGKPKYWFVGAELTLQNTTEIPEFIFNNRSASGFENTTQFSFGGFYIPQYNATSSYFKRVVYRGGFNFGNTGLIVENESINEFGISFGIGLPVGNRSLLSNVNLGFEIGQRGTTNQNLVQENFIKLNVSLSLNSRWFRKKKYN